MEPKKIILCPNPDRDTGMKATKSAIAILRDMGFQTVVCSPFRDPKTDAFGDLPSKPLLPELKGADLVITLGGDGTILHLAKLAALHKIPMLGINMGGLGFLAELEVGSLNALRGLKNWDFPIEERMMLDVSVLRDGKQIYTNMGLNDAVIREGPISHVIHLEGIFRRKAPCGHRGRRRHHCHPHRLHSLFTLRRRPGGGAGGPDPDSDTHLHPQYALFLLRSLSGPHPDGLFRAQWPQADIPVCG